MSNQIQFFEHPKFKKLKKDWVKFKDLYDGDHDTLKDPCYLWMHEFESIKAKGGIKTRKIRENRTRYLNRARAIINRYISLAFQEEIVISDADKEMLGDDIYDIDGDGNDLQTFIKNNIAIPVFRDGKVAITVDGYNYNAESLAEEKELNLRPYAFTWNALHMPDWVNKYIGARAINKYDAVRLEWQETMWRDSLTQEPKQKRISTIYQQIDSNKVSVKTYFASPKKDNTVNSDDWALEFETEVDSFRGKIPIIILEQGGLMKDWADLLLRIYNKQSALDNQLNQQAFQRIFIATDMDATTDIQINEGAIAVIPKDASFEVIEPTNPIALIESLKDDLTALYQIAFHQTRILPTDSKGIEGAETQQVQKEEFFEIIKKIAKEIEGAVNEFLELYAEMKGRANYTADVKFNLDWSIEDKEQQMEIYRMLSSEIAKYETWHKELLKKFATYYNFEEETQAVIQDEIESGAIVSTNINNQVSNLVSRAQVATAITEA